MEEGGIAKSAGNSIIQRRIDKERKRLQARGAYKEVPRHSRRQPLRALASARDKISLTLSLLSQFHQSPLHYEPDRVEQDDQE
jgi:hypothetical protein